VQGGKASRVGKGGVLVSGSAAGAGAVGPPVPWRGGDWGGDGPGPRPPNRLVPGGRIFARPVAGERHGGRRNRAAVARTGDEGFSRLPGSEQTDRGGLVGWRAACGGRAPAEPDARGRGPLVGRIICVQQPACLPTWLGLYFV
jgi:hypothetical protein